MRTRAARIVMPAACLVLAASPAPGAEEAGPGAGIRLAPRLRYTAGAEVYEISDAGAEISRLRFGIENLLGEIEVAARVGPVLGLRGAFWTNLDRPAGTLTDRDYLAGFGCPDLRSRSDLAVRIVGARAAADFAIPVGASLRLTLGPQLDFEHLFFAADDTRYPPNPCYTGSLFIPERGLEYERSRIEAGPAARLEIPIAGNLEARVRARIGSAFVWDRDDHLLRSKVSRAWALGPSGALEVGLVWRLVEALSVEASAGLSGYYAWGEQRQRFYAGPDAGLRFDGIDDAIWGERLWIAAGVALHFGSPIRTRGAGAIGVPEPCSGEPGGLP